MKAFECRNCSDGLVDEIDKIGLKTQQATIKKVITDLESIIKTTWRPKHIFEYVEKLKKDVKE